MNTPVEALELEFPVRVTRYALRTGSGGVGAHYGGDGVIRELEALQDMIFSVIGERRRHAPKGAAGGGDGALGRTVLTGADGTQQKLDGKTTGTLRTGARLRQETPGGGGYGAPPAPS